MRIVKGVRGAKEWTSPIIVTYDTIYTHSNVKRVEEESENVGIGLGEELYEFDEIQYTKDEYLQLMAYKQQTESDLTTQIDMDVQGLALKQKTESELITQHDIDIFALINRITSLERRVEELEGWN